MLIHLKNLEKKGILCEIWMNKISLWSRTPEDSNTDDLENSIKKQLPNSVSFLSKVKEPTNFYYILNVGKHRK